MEEPILTPSQIMEQPEQYVGEEVTVRGFLLIANGVLVSEEPLQTLFEAAIVQLELPDEEMYRLVNRPDYVPSAFLMIDSLNFVDTLMRQYKYGFVVGSQYVFKAYILVRAHIRRKLHHDGTVYYELHQLKSLRVEDSDNKELVSFD